MILAAIYNVYDGVELLGPSIRQIINHVDMVIIVSQRVSNYGETLTKDPRNEIDWKNSEGILNWVDYYPDRNKSPRWNESKKRNLGLFYAKKWGATHFLHMDCDELYNDFGAAKQEYIDSGAEGSVCKMYTYFKKPTLRFEKIEGYYVPFIHELKDNSIAAKTTYPFYVDPTRKINCSNVAELKSMMHHFSWVRKDIDRKIRNSTARVNIERSQLLQDYNNPDIGSGFYLKDYDTKLVEVDDVFNLMPIFDNP